MDVTYRIEHFLFQILPPRYLQFQWEHQVTTDLFSIRYSQARYKENLKASRLALMLIGVLHTLVATLPNARVSSLTIPRPNLYNADTFSTSQRSTTLKSVLPISLLSSGHLAQHF